MADKTQRSAGAQPPGAGEPEAAGGFDDVIVRLRSVVERLENGSLGLEQALAAFEDGVRLSRRGAEILDQAERRVELLGRGEGGGVEAMPMPALAGDGDGPP